MAGCVTLAKSVIQAMPSYVMQSASLPRGLCDEIDRKCRDFIWGDTEHQRHIHLASWSSICVPKKFGGLGLRTARDINTSFMMKAGWNLCARKNDMWVQIIRTKYKCGGELIPKINMKRQGSNLWRGICKNWNLVNSNLVWRVGNGNSINFCTDQWIPNVGCLRELTIRPLSQVEMGDNINHFVTASGQWDWRRISEWLPIQIVEQIKSVIPPHVLSGDDTLAWNGSTDGSFSTSLAYNFLLTARNLQANLLYNVIWSWKGPERVRFFLWKAARGILMTNQIRHRRGLTNSDLCPVCQQFSENPLHLFRDCGTSRSVWWSLYNDIPSIFFEEENFARWLLFNLKAKSRLEFGKWSVIFATTLDRIWWARNEMVFKQIPLALFVP